MLACLRLMVFNRRCDPSSRLGVLRWLQAVALPLGYGFAEGLPDHQHLLRAMDALNDHRVSVSGPAMSGTPAGAAWASARVASRRTPLLKAVGSTVARPARTSSEAPRTDKRQGL